MYLCQTWVDYKVEPVVLYALVYHFFNAPICKKGFFRLLDPEYYFRVLTFIVNYIEAESLSLTRIPAGDVVDKVSELEPR